MASSIIHTTIDEQYPVAGVDNDSQGFRDNFSIIKDNFSIAANEITDLQDNVLLRAPLTGQDTAAFETQNSLNNATLSTLNLKSATLESNNTVAGDADRTVSFNVGHYFPVTVDTSLTLTCSDWPSEHYAEIYIELKASTSNQDTVTFASTNSGGAPTATYLVDTATEALSYWTTRTLTLDSATDPRDIVKLWTADGGITVFIQHVGRFQ